MELGLRDNKEQLSGVLIIKVHWNLFPPSFPIFLVPSFFPSTSCFVLLCFVFEIVSLICLKLATLLGSSRYLCLYSQLWDYTCPELWLSLPLGIISLYWSLECKGSRDNVYGHKCSGSSVSMYGWGRLTRITYREADQLYLVGFEV